MEGLNKYANLRIVGHKYYKVFQGDWKLYMKSLKEVKDYDRILITPLIEFKSQYDLGRWEGKDFFEYTPKEDYDYIISNPPFTRKYDILKRLFELEKPFAMILGLPILNYQIFGKYMFDKQEEGKDLQLLIC